MERYLWILFNLFRSEWLPWVHFLEGRGRQVQVPHRPLHRLLKRSLDADRAGAVVRVDDDDLNNAAAAAAPSSAALTMTTKKKRKKAAGGKK